MKYLIATIFLLATVSPFAAASSYEVWACDQSNTVAGQTSLGVKGSYLWIWDSDDIENQVNGGDDATPLSCSPNEATGPCDVFTIFPPSLEEYDASGNPTGEILDTLPRFGRLHGALHDPQNRYVNFNLFARSGG